MDQPLSDNLEATIRLVLRHYAIDLDRGALITGLPVQGFSGALVLRLQSSGGKSICLRRWPSRGLPHPRLFELHRFLRFLHTEGIHCLPVPLETHRGETFVESDRHLWQLEPWMPGVADFRQSPSEVRLSAIMRLLARVHRVASRYEATAVGREWFRTDRSQSSPALGERITMIDQWTQQRIDHAVTAIQRDCSQPMRDTALEMLGWYRQSHGRVRAELAGLTQQLVPIHPCMRDVWHDHVLFTGDDVTGLIDPAATRTDTVATDLSRLLGSLIGDVFDPRWVHALDVYNQTRPLSISEHQLIRVLHLSGVLLSGMTWIERRLRGSLTDEMLPRVLDRLQGICECWRSCQQV
ncbi:MAG: phosphotransferase [Planctomycetaceae bacterium]